MNKDTKIIIGTIAILFVCLIVSDSSITGQAFFDRLRFWRRGPSAVPGTPVIKLVPTAPSLSSPSYTPISKVRKAPYCKDTDGGININIKGFVNSNSYQAYDICDWDNSIYVWERYCDNIEPRSRKINCGPGKICNDGKCVSSGSTDYLSLTIEYASGEDLAKSNYPGMGTSERVIKISAPGIERFSFVDNTAIKTSKVWITQDSNSFLVFYHDLNKFPTMQYFGNVSYPNRYLLNVPRSGDVIMVEPGGGAEALTNVVLAFDGSDERYIQANFKSNNWEINSLGNIQSLAENRELGVQEDGHKYIGDYNNDYFTKDGTIIKNPKLNGDSDKVVLEVPI